MATETVIYVSLALVLLTRIYVFISPPEFLEQHKDRRYHEYHLYRQYHIRKQTDDDGQDSRLKDEHEDDLAELLLSHSRRSSSATQENYGGFVDPSPLTALHYPSDELVLLGMGSGARPLPLSELSTSGFSKHESLAAATTTTPSTLSTPTSATATTGIPSPYSPRDNGQDAWKHIIGASDTGVKPSYLSLDTSEIHYSGSLQRFEKDPEVLESIRALKTGQRDMAKECPIMTVVWEGGRWCCLEGRTLYILRALDWKGQVRVRVLVDKDPTTLAVTEECWKAAGMTSDLTPLFITLGRRPSTTSTTRTSAIQLETTSPSSIPSNKDDVLGTKSSRVYMSTATADPSATTIGLSLDNNSFDGRILMGAPEVEANVRHSLSNSRKGSSLSGSHSDDDADVDEDESGPESEGGYMEDDEGETEEDDDSEIEEHHQQQQHTLARLHALSLQQQQNHQPTAVRQRQRMFPLTVQDESENNSDLTIVSPPSPILLPASAVQLPSDPIRKPSFGSTNLPGGKVTHHHPRALSQSKRSHHHERKISIPEFMLPPPLHDEQVYLIVDPSSQEGGSNTTLLREKNPPRRDSGHGDSS
ncbi:hypothetical protein BGX29_009594 [Mortierella sp. GBA35]|nr:hypothetical protein BGX29_009594 [Mortierella sp. GBA35]